MSNSERFLWVCELNKEQAVKKWKATDLTEDDDDDDQDYVLHSLVVKTAVLGVKAVDGERNVVALKTKGYGDKELNQPIFSLTLGRNDMISNLDLIISTRDNQEVEFELVEGTGPVHITCLHVLEIPAPEEGQTIMTTSDVEEEEEEGEESEDIEEEEMSEDKPKVKNGKAPLKNGAAALKNGKGINGTNGVHNGEEIAVDEQPKKRKRN